MSEIGIIVVSHSKKIADGIANLVNEVAKDISLTYVGGTPDGGIGTSFEQVQNVVESNPKDTLLAFFDLGSARMNIEMVQDFTDKDIILNIVPIVEGTYTAAALLQAGTDLETVKTQLAELEIKK
ncbi:dihydroxyacetone kinase, phosphotransfer subunit [Streptococcus urinalis FB127-CNA-2]|uniref:phosphoenolpyruvate--glycerone phosphotransferase n=1 Tax=Streptococcus urinalis 2285-97 TaxID=764291 RepID=G5KIC0_9STRE|nr:dihydroxyacetone kinase phosphoryl donor subunit DhaM [Streptococcus urinalis]EHJ56796.1 dihydroxyacetone kinase, phosphotransfer subunit [Streptococcus urinalis 2285-97]EKS17266.1 dihydroxyacetone kinase, phosphotransfer subunit [Streptococcus urinalis FB127-CNA-2]VEF32484.1 PTS IIA component superfamily protein [Streptococcus urinalis]